jgi:hypothetical protein
MKRIAQVMPGILDEATLNGWRKYLHKLIIVEDGYKADPSIPMILYANPLGHTEWWMRNKYPFFAINRPYIGSWLERKRFSHRVSVNSFACTALGNISHSRWATTRLKKEPWKVKEVKNVLIAPSKKSQGSFTQENVLDWADRLKQELESQGANVKIRPKTGKKGAQHWGDITRGVTGVFGDNGDFEWADLVISYSSAITAEAFWYVKKAISLGVCPTWIACDNHLNNWRDPAEPVNRDIWHEHMSWIQFNYDEWYNGSAQEMTVHYQGWPADTPNTNNEFAAKV